VPFLRPAELAADTSSHLSVVEHALEWVALERPDLAGPHRPAPADIAPENRPPHIDACVDLADRKQADAVVSVCEAEDTPFLLKRFNDRERMEDFVTSGTVLCPEAGLPRRPMC